MFGYFKNQLIKLGVIGVGFVGFTAYDIYDKSTNYVPVNGEVQQVADNCHLEWHKRRSNSKTDIMPCADAIALKQSDPSTYDRYDLEYDTQLTVAFISPADKHRHVATLVQHLNEKGAEIHVGDNLPVLANKKEPEHLRSI